MFAHKLLMCACAAIIATTVAAENIKCSPEASYGTCNGSSREVHYKMGPGEDNKTFTVGSAECGQQGGVSGVRAVACDYDVAPSVTVPNLYQVHVYRNGNYQNYAGVTLTVCCFV